MKPCFYTILTVTMEMFLFPGYCAFKFRHHVFTLHVALALITRIISNTFTQIFPNIPQVRNIQLSFINGCVTTIKYI